MLYDVIIIYFETDTSDELRKPGFSKERRIDPQITVGMLLDANSFPPDRCVRRQYGRNAYHIAHDPAVPKRLGRALPGIDEQVTKAHKAVECKIQAERNRYVKMTTDSKTVNWQLILKNRALAGSKRYETNRLRLPAEQVISADRQLFQLEKFFRIPKHELKTPPDFPWQTRLDPSAPDYRENCDGHRPLPRMPLRYVTETAAPNPEEIPTFESPFRAEQSTWHPKPHQKSSF